MPQVRIRHAIASWFDKPDDQVPLSAFRGQVVDMPESEITRLKRHGAVIDPEIELDRPGVLGELPETPSDEELINYVMNASTAEIQAVVDRRPDLGGRIHAATLRISDERSRMDEHLENVRSALRGTVEPVHVDDDILIGATPSFGTEPEGGPAGATIVPPGSEAPPPPQQPPNVPQPASLSELVKGNVSDVSAYVQAHPDEAQAVLEAEAESRNGAPRAGVVAAVQAAIASSNP